MTPQELKHSYSAIKDFENCPRKYHEVRILKKFKSAETQATLYGTEVHKALEEFLMEGKDLPEKFYQFLPYVTPLAKVNGEIKCELKMGIRKDFTPCGFFDKDVWFRGVPDYLALNRDKGVARVGDWKTGKSSRYADTGQLELMAAMVMSHYPEINKVKGALLFIVAGDVIKADYDRSQFADIMSRWAGRASMIETALESGVWNPKSSPLCGFCPVSTCHHHRG